MKKNLFILVATISIVAVLGCNQLSSTFNPYPLEDMKNIILTSFADFSGYYINYCLNKGEGIMPPLCPLDEEFYADQFFDSLNGKISEQGYEITVSLYGSNVVCAYGNGEGENVDYFYCKPKSDILFCYEKDIVSGCVTGVVFDKNQSVVDINFSSG